MKILRVSVLLLLSNLVLVNAICPEMDAANNCERDVLIIGAGMSGVAAARALSDLSDLTFVWAEARNVIGGRMHYEQDAFEDGIGVEEGAAFVQGGEGNPLLELFHEQSDLDHWQANWNSFTAYRISDDDTVEEFKKSDPPFEDFEEAWNCAIQTADDCLQDDFSDPVCHKSLRDVMKEDCSTRWEPSNILEEMVEDYTITFNTGKKADQVGVKELPTWTYVDFQAKDFSVEDPKGYKLVPEDMAAGLEQQPCFDTTVTKVRWNEYPVLVETENGGSCRVKNVISTLSVGYLLAGENVDLFEPKPDATLDALDRTFEMSNYGRLFYKFDRDFWDREWVIFARTDSENGADNDCLLWINLSRNSGSAYYHKSNILVCILTSNQVVDDEVASDLLEPLRKIYGTGSKGVPEAFSYKYHNWDADEFARGSYEVFKPGATNTDFDYSIAPLVNGDGDEVVFWAGNHGCERHAAYVHGALTRGDVVGKLVINNLDDTRDLDTRSICDEAPSGGFGNPGFQTVRGN